MQFRIFQIGSNSGIVNFDLNTGQSNPQDGLSGQSSNAVDWSISDYGMEPYLNGWYRVWTTFQVTGSTCSIGILGIDDINASDVSGVYKYTSNGTAGYYIAGIQVEEGSNKTSVIQTSGSTVTRSPDIAEITGTNFSGFHNTSEGTYVIETDASAGSTSAQARGFVVSDGTNSHRIATDFKEPNALNLFFQAGGSATALASNIAGLPRPIKAAITYKAGDYRGAYDGQLALTSTFGSTPVVNQLSIGSQNFTSDGYFNGHIKSLTYYSTLSDDATLETLTTP
jgi:hypothetical protein